MSSIPSPYYSSMSSAGSAFTEGNPVLAYHKLGPRPRRVRLKGLYASTQLFSAQLKELQQAGYRSGSLTDCAGAHQSGRIVITFDDGYLNVLQHGLRPLAQFGFKAIQFLPADLLGRSNEWDVAAGEAPETIMNIEQVREWLAAGHDIGSHTLNHPYLTQLSATQAREQILASKKKLEDTFARPIEHFCYPYGDWNPAIRDLVAAAGYRTACTTATGANTADTSPFELKRFTVRYQSRNLKTLRETIRRGWRQWF
ncbi:MAG: polysaccharide deacetylase family protein [Verrucomicrobiota bacterium]